MHMYVHEYCMHDSLVIYFEKGCKKLAPPVCIAEVPNVEPW